MAGTSPTTRQRWRVPFCTTTSPGDSNTSAPSSTSTTMLPERRTPKSAAYQLREARLAESLLNRVVSSVEDWAKSSFHRAGHHASLMHLAAHRKNSALAFTAL